MDTCEYLFLRDNLLTDLPATTCNGLTNPKRLALNGNKLTSLTETVLKGDSQT